MFDFMKCRLEGCGEEARRGQAVKVYRVYFIAVTKLTVLKKARSHSVDHGETNSNVSDDI